MQMLLNTKDKMDVLHWHMVHTEGVKRHNEMWDDMINEKMGE